MADHGRRGTPYRLEPIPVVSTLQGEFGDRSYALLFREGPALPVSRFVEPFTPDQFSIEINAVLVCHIRVESVAHALIFGVRIAVFDAYFALGNFGVPLNSAEMDLACCSPES